MLEEHKLMIKNAVVVGGQLAAAKKANEVLVSMAKAGMAKAGVSDKVLENEMVDHVLAVSIPLLLHFIAHEYPSMIPKSELVKKGAAMAMTASAAETIKPLLDAIQPMLVSLAKAAASMADVTVGAEAEVVDPQPLQEAEKIDMSVQHMNEILSNK